MKTTFDVNFRFWPSSQTAWHIHEHENKEKLSIKSFSLFIFKLIIWKKLVRKLNLNKKVVFIVLIQRSTTVYFSKNLIASKSSLSQCLILKEKVLEFLFSKNGAKTFFFYRSKQLLVPIKALKNLNFLARQFLGPRL